MINYGKKLFDERFGEECDRLFERRPKVETLLRDDVKPGYVQPLKDSSGLNPVVHEIMLNFFAMRKCLISLDKNLKPEIGDDAVQWLMDSFCEDGSHGKSNLCYFLLIFTT